MSTQLYSVSWRGLRKIINKNGDRATVISHYTTIQRLPTVFNLNLRNQKRFQPIAHLYIHIIT